MDLYLNKITKTQEMKIKYYSNILFIFLFSCSKNLQVINKKNIVFKQTYPIQNISNKNKQWNILIQTSSYFTENILYHNIHFTGSFKKDNKNSISSISFNDLSIAIGKKYFDSTISTQSPNQIFGKNLKLKVKDLQVDIGYIPTLLNPTNNIQSTVMYTNGDYFSGVILKPNFKFTWAKDSLNKNGVFIYLEFDPKHLGNEKHINNFSKILSNLIIVDDNGSYLIDEKMFEGFPSNSLLSFYIGRTNFFNINKMDGIKTPLRLLTASYCIGDFYYKSN